MHFFCVADLRRLPFADQSFDSVVEIFSPSDYGEFKRVLKPGGRLIKVIPNAEYLVELRQLLYPSGEHAKYDNSNVIDLFKKNTIHKQPLRPSDINFRYRLR